MASEPKPLSEAEERTYRTIAAEVPASILAKLLATLDAERAKCRKAQESEGVAWTIIAKIAEPIRRCFRDRTMPFAELQRIAVGWEQSIAGEGHPDTLRRERDAERDRREAAEAVIGAMFDQWCFENNPESTDAELKASHKVMMATTQAWLAAKGRDAGKS